MVSGCAKPAQAAAVKHRHQNRSVQGQAGWLRLIKGREFVPTERRRQRAQKAQVSLFSQTQRGS
jgi:hypothetical protein